MSNQLHDHTTFEAGASQTVTISGTSAQSSAVGTYTFVVRLISTTDCYVAFASNPTATTSDMFIPGDKIERFFRIRPGDKIAAIQDSAGGTLYITEVFKGEDI